MSTGRNNRRRGRASKGLSTATRSLIAEARRDSLASRVDFSPRIDEAPSSRLEQNRELLRMLRLRTAGREWWSDVEPLSAGGPSGSYRHDPATKLCTVVVREPRHFIAYDLGMSPIAESSQANGELHALARELRSTWLRDSELRARLLEAPWPGQFDVSTHPGFAHAGRVRADPRAMARSKRTPDAPVLTADRVQPYDLVEAVVTTRVVLRRETSRAVDSDGLVAYDFEDEVSADESIDYLAATMRQLPAVHDDAVIAATGPARDELRARLEAGLCAWCHADNYRRGRCWRCGDVESEPHTLRTLRPNALRAVDDQAVSDVAYRMRADRMVGTFRGQAVDLRPELAPLTSVAELLGLVADEDLAIVRGFLDHGAPSDTVPQPPSLLHLELPIEVG